MSDARLVLWVIITSVVSFSRFSRSKISITCSPVSWSRFPVGSSASTIRGRLTKARAIAGTNIVITAVGVGSSHTLIGQTPTATATLGMGTPQNDVGASEVTHIGWVKKTIGTGGRAGRVFYETLVAASSITGDAEDLATPDS